MNWIWNKLLTKECVIVLIATIVILLIIVWAIDDRSQRLRIENQRRLAMNENDFKAIEDLAELATGDNAGAASIELECRLRLVPAIIARQLTRIADGMLASEDVELEKEMQEAATPPDALVEAAENIKAALVSNAAPTDVIYALRQSLIERGEESVSISPTLLIPLLEALAAHKKGVR